MKVKELITKLQEYPEEFEVVLAIDEEGNGYNSLSEFGMGHYDSAAREFSSWVEYEEDDDGDEIEINPPRVRTIAESNSIVLWP